MSEADLETIKRSAQGGEDFIAIQGCSATQALDAIYRDAISLGRVSYGTRYADCTWETERDEVKGCICPMPRSLSEYAKPDLRGPQSIVINPLTGEHLCYLRTPILNSIHRFLRGVYAPFGQGERWRKRSDERYLLAVLAEQAEQPKPEETR